MLPSLSIALIAFGVASVATYVLARPGGWLQILDHPNERSLHSTPVPRTGGLAIWAGGIAGTGVALLLFGLQPDLGWIAGTAFVVAAVSFIDDRSHVPVAARLTAQLAAGGLLVAGGLGTRSIGLPGVELYLSGEAALLLSLLFIVWMTNLYNFMDGMDGFAGGMAVIGFGTFAMLGWVADAPVFASCSLVVAASAAGFLLFNFPPARIFMGDIGSSSLGFLAAAFMLWAARDGTFPLWIGVLIFAPFIVDATVTLLRRLLRRDKIWIAHKAHYYQRLVQLGWGHKSTVIAEYLLMLSCALSAAFVLQQPPAIQWAILGLWVALFAALASMVDWHGKRISREKNAGNNEEKNEPI